MLCYGQSNIARNRHIDGTYKTCGKPLVLRKYLNETPQTFCSYDDASYGYILYQPKHLGRKYCCGKADDSRFIITDPVYTCGKFWNQQMADQDLFRHYLQYDYYLNRYES